MFRAVASGAAFDVAVGSGPARAHVLLPREAAPAAVAAAAAAQRR